MAPPVMLSQHMMIAIKMGRNCKIRKLDRWMKLTEDPMFYGREDFKIMSETILK